jgi:hypothetical protein
VSAANAYLDDVGRVVEALNGLGREPILVGGMALVLLGSQRVTRDFDFVIPHPAEHLSALVDVFYDRELELVSRLDDAGQVAATIDNRRVAAIRLRLDAPTSAFFYKWSTGLRIDLLFDFPIPAAVLAEQAIETRVSSFVLRLASEADLLRLKQIAVSHRAAPGDAQDIAFLKGRRKRR